MKMGPPCRVTRVAGSLTVSLLCLGALACGSSGGAQSLPAASGPGPAMGGPDSGVGLIDASASPPSAPPDAAIPPAPPDAAVAEAAADASPDAGPPLTAQQAILLLQRGINLGNSFDAPPGETAWGNPAIQDYYFDDYKIAGFDAVRIPVTWDQHTGTSAPYTIDETFLSRVEQVIDWGLARGLFILVNAHHEEWLKQSFSPDNVSRFSAIWTQLSTRFKDKSDHLVFEVLNEPEVMTAANLDSLNDQILAIMRQTNPTRLVVYAGTNYSSDADLKQAKVPGTPGGPVDPYLIANFHCYSPWSFVSGGPDVIWGSQADKDAIQAIFDGVAQFAQSKGLPAMVNEFGAGPNHDTSSRTAFYQTYVDNTLNHGMAFFAWDDGGNFQTYLRQLPADHMPGGQWVGNVKDIMTH